MKHERLNKGLLYLVLICFLLAMTAGNAMALSTAYSYATVDWSSFSVATTENLTLWNMVGYYDGSESTSAYPYPDSYFPTTVAPPNNWNTFGSAINSQGETDDYPDDVGYSYVNPSVTGAEAEGWTPGFYQNDGKSVGTEAEASVSAAGEYAKAQTTSWWANGLTQENLIVFALDGSGSITVSIDYLLGLYLETEIENDYAIAGSSIELHAGLLTDVIYDEYGQPIELIYSDKQTGTTTYFDSLSASVSDGDDLYEDDYSVLTESGEATLTLDITGASNISPEFFFVYIQTSSTAESYAAPEPGTMLLLGAGLIGLAGYRRKRK